MALRNHQGKANPLEALTSSCRCTAPPLLEVGRLVCGKCGAPIGVSSSGPTGVYTQHDGERPPGCGRVRFLRVWRAAAAAGDLGATEDGRSRLLTVEAYQRHAGLRTRPPKPPPSAPVAVPSADDDALAALGLERRSA